MRLNDLLQAANLIQIPLTHPVGNQFVQAIKTDSRTIEPFDVFVSIPCPTAIDYIETALDKGCRVFVVESELADHPLFQEYGVLVVTHANPRLALTQLAAAFYHGAPSTCVAVTGTNGKTSTVHYVRQFWEHAHRLCASVGTLGLTLNHFYTHGKEADHNISHTDPTAPYASLLNGASLTTLDSLRLHQLMQELRKNDIDYLAFEASSHGLDQYRIHGVSLKAAAFTNLTQDHMDYHQTMQDYFKAKTRLFTEVLPEGAIAIINDDTPYSKQLYDICHMRNQIIWRFSRQPNSSAELLAMNCRVDGQSQIIDLTIHGKYFSDIRLNVTGDFQIENVLAALGLALASGLSIEECLSTFPLLHPANGRLEHVATYNNAHFYVDYAHTPDALEKAIINLRPFVTSRLWVVFGCGGNRDTTKRPLMGKIAATHADVCIITDDNPRFEEPELIRRSILEACPDGIEIPNRRDAIAYAIHKAKPGDVVLIAGKGHERGQTIGNTTFPFDDHEEILKAVTL